jgi:hypothetical protein
MSNKDGSPSVIDWRLIDANTKIVANEWKQQTIDYNHSVLASLGLPYREMKGVQSFVRTSGNTTLRLRAGQTLMSDGSYQDVGLPFGSKARLVLIWCVSEAIKNQNPVVSIERSFTRFVSDLGFSTSGYSIKTMREQVKRLSVLSMSMSVEADGFTDVHQTYVFSKFRVITSSDKNQYDLFPSEIEFSKDFFLSLMEHAVPLNRDALVALRHNARALDIYQWLSSRLYRIGVNRSVHIRWSSLKYQFGVPTQNSYSFRARFRDALEQVLLVYPNADVRQTKTGLSLRYSPPPISRSNSQNRLRHDV